jgi:hypothetical protein
MPFPAIHFRIAELRGNGYDKKLLTAATLLPDLTTLNGVQRSISDRIHHTPSERWLELEGEWPELVEGVRLHMITDYEAEISGWLFSCCERSHFNPLKRMDMTSVLEVGHDHSMAMLEPGLPRRISGTVKDIGPKYFSEPLGKILNEKSEAMERYLSRYFMLLHAYCTGLQVTSMIPRGSNPYSLVRGVLKRAENKQHFPYYK